MSPQTTTTPNAELRNLVGPQGVPSPAEPFSQSLTLDRLTEAHSQSTSPTRLSHLTLDLADSRRLTDEAPQPKNIQDRGKLFSLFPLVVGRTRSGFFFLFSFFPLLYIQTWPLDSTKKKLTYFWGKKYIILVCWQRMHITDPPDQPARKSPTRPTRIPGGYAKFTVHHRLELSKPNGHGSGG
jgi:hypothetical protein